jgi:DNA-binding transcriptional LysR family regulator
MIVRRAERGELGELRVGFTSSAAFSTVIPQLIFEYRRRLPGVHLRLEELSTQQQLTAMLEHRLEVAFVRGAAKPALPPTLQPTRLFEDALVAVLPAQHPLALSGEALSIGALKDEAFVMYPREIGTGVYDQILALCQHAGFAPKVSQEAREAPTIVGLVAAGLGVALVPASLRCIKVNGVAYRPLREQGASSAMWMVLRAGALPPQEALFATLARNLETGNVPPFSSQRRVFLSSGQPTPGA